ncbi:MAG: ABC transporter ATP-binding protein/permease [Spirochaetes bacterium]|nr:ABC transporter ATP-binding protein/permease [Spirochaetota bacterium]
MDFYHEEDKNEGKLYSKEVYSLLFKYIFKYKKYFILSILFVFIISGVTVVTPYISKIIVDRYISKTGKIINKDIFYKLETDDFYRKQLKKGIKLSNEYIFILNSDLKYFSKKKMEFYTENNAILNKDFLLIELDKNKIDKKIIEKLDSLVLEDKANKFGISFYTIDSKYFNNFTFNELVIIRSKDFKNVILYSLLIILLLFIQFFITYIQIIFLMKLSQYSMRDLREDLFKHITSLEISFFDRNPIGKIVNRVTNDIETLNELFSNVLVTLFQDILMMGGIAIVMFFTDIYLASIIAISFPFIVILTIYFRYAAREAYRKIRTKISQLNAFLNETITGIRIIQIFVQEIKNYKKFMKNNNELYKANIEQLYVYATFRPLIGFLRWFALGSLIYFGAKGILQNRVSYGLIIMFVAYIESFFSPVQDFAEKFDIMQSANAAGEKILSILNTNFMNEFKEEEKLKDYEKKYIKLTYNADDLYRFKGHIIFDNVWFSYTGDDNWVLRGVSFEVKPQESLAIVGETGAGKTTITNILNKFYKIQKGKILIDGKDINDIPHSILRRNISIVMQDVFLFSRTIRENIVLNKEFNEEYYKLVKKLTFIDDFINNLRDKDDEEVMERGATFSAGEKQLLSFARALYFNPSILILDEATSNIDTHTEKLIQEAIKNLMKGRTTIAIAHRLSTIRDSKNIIVLDRGKIVEQGNHDELLKNKGIYYNLYKLQFSKI